MSAGFLLSRLGHRQDQGSQQVPGGSCWSPSPPADGWVCSSSLWALLAGPGYPTELCSTNPPGPCTAFVDQSLWVYPEIIKIPMFKPLKLWQWKPLMHLTGLCFWSGRFGAFCCLALPLSCFSCHRLLVLTKENEYFHAQPNCNRNPLLVIFEDVC